MTRIKTRSHHGHRGTNGQVKIAYATREAAVAAMGRRGGPDVFRVYECTWRVAALPDPHWHLASTAWRAGKIAWQNGGRGDWARWRLDEVGELGGRVSAHLAGENLGARSRRRAEIAKRVGSADRKRRQALAVAS